VSLYEDAQEEALRRLQAMAAAGASPVAAPPVAAPRALPRATRKASAGGTLSGRVQPGEESIRRGLELMSAEDDYTAASDFARQRSVQGEDAMLNAIAASVAGRRFEPLRGAFLKRAMAAQDPMKVGTATIGPDGTVLRDPSAGRERESDRLLRLGQFEMGLDERRQARSDAASERQEARMLRQTLAGQGTWSHVQDPNTGQVLLYNSRTGQTQPLAGGAPGAGGMPAAAPGSMAAKPGFNIPQGALPPLTETQDKSRFFAQNMVESLPTMVDAIKEGYRPNRQDQAAAGPPSSGWLGGIASTLTPRSFASDQGRAFYTEGRKVLAAILRKESGAAITDDEWSSYGPIYLPWPGDSNADIDRKMQALQNSATSMAIGAGPAYKFFNAPAVGSLGADDDGVIDLPSLGRGR
jgi:hypothetical protein